MSVSASPENLIVAITGATGATYGIRLLEVLRQIDGVRTHLIISPGAARTIPLETDWRVGDVEALADVAYRPNDIAAAPASGSFRTLGMVILPCSIRTLAGVATSESSNLILRTADVQLKERRPLILGVRETPLHLGHLRLLVGVAELGAVVMPPMPAFYHEPRTIADLVDQAVGRILDQLRLDPPADLFRRWAGPARTSRTGPSGVGS
jgi:4-hydroxy-3-polyprenylbenzoate decarboxylase